MALDYQKRSYVPRQQSTMKRTTYGFMNHWQDFVKRPPDNPYEAGRSGHFSNSAHVLDIPLPRHQVHPDRKEFKPDSRQHQVQKSSMDEDMQSEVDEETAAYISRRLRDKRSAVTRYLEEREKATRASMHSHRGKDSRSPSGGTRHQKGKMSAMRHSAPGVHEQYHKSGGYDDYHRTYLQLGKLGITPTYPIYGPPKLRNGGNGGSWRHVKQVLQAGGSRNLFIDGEIRVMDTSRVLEGKGTAVRAIQPVHDRPRTSYSPLFHKASAPAHELEEFKATEQGNWMVMR